MNRTIVTALAILSVHEASCSAQGTFQNLGFDTGTLVPVTPGLNMVDAASALPGWTVLLNNIQSSTVRHDDITLGSWSVSIHDAQSLLLNPVIVGKYSVFLQGGVLPGSAPGPAAIAQTAQLPEDSRSMTFKASRVVGLRVLINGQNAPYSILNTGPTYNLYGVDVNAFAGRLGEIKFEAAAGFDTSALIDDIQFSTAVVPEPGAISLLIGGGFIFGVTMAARKRLLARM